MGETSFFAMQPGESVETKFGRLFQHALETDKVLGSMNNEIKSVRTEIKESESRMSGAIKDMGREVMAAFKESKAETERALDRQTEDLRPFINAQIVAEEAAKKAVENSQVKANNWTARASKGQLIGVGISLVAALAGANAIGTTVSKYLFPSNVKVISTPSTPIPVTQTPPTAPVATPAP